MSINVANAAGAYTDAIKRMAQAASGENTSPEKSGGKSGVESFGQMLAQQVSGVESAAKASEAAATQAVSGGSSNLVDLVTQVAEAELMLQTAVTVRDRVITAYQEIMRMPI